MHDQANKLRRLVRDHAATDAPLPEPRPGLAILTGGKGGVGTTTIAVNLAAAMARGGRRTVLLDADPRGGDVATLCRLQQRYTLDDVLSGRRSIPQVLQAGPGPIRVVPGDWGRQRRSDYPAAVDERLLGQLQRLGAECDLVVVDAGNNPGAVTPRWWRDADLILVLTTAETASILGAYASIKAVAESGKPESIHTLVNRSPGAEIAEDVHGRLARACRRFLGIPLQNAGHVPDDPRVAAAAASGEPFVIAAPGCGAARQMKRLGKVLGDRLADAKTLGNPSHHRKHESVKKREKTIQPPTVYNR